MATIGLTAVDNPLEFGIVITREDGTIERFLEKPTWGQVFSDTINTGHLRARARRSSTIIPDGRSVDFSSEVFPALLAAGKPLFGAIVDGLLGGRRHARGLPQRPPRRARPEGRCRHPRLPDQRRRVDRRGRRDLAGGARSIGPAVIGPGCKVEAGCPTRRVRRARLATSACSAEADIERVVLHDNVYVGHAGTGCGAPSSAGRRTSATTSASTRAWCSATRCSSAPTPCSAADVKVYPFKTIEDGAVVNSCIVWESQGGPQPVRSRRASPGWPTSTSRPSWPRKVAMAYGTSLPQGRPRSSRRVTRAGRRGCSSGR